mmetsp:Transcript_23107/g.50772  ORF Transcript_23107/g.50772 Transcript_23107/m.50772 type:complete len:89 (-) Transcript_23107:2-268(-)
MTGSSQTCLEKGTLFLFLAINVLVQESRFYQGLTALAVWCIPCCCSRGGPNNMQLGCHGTAAKPKVKSGKAPRGSGGCHHLSLSTNLM